MPCPNPRGALAFCPGPQLQRRPLKEDQTLSVLNLSIFNNRAGYRPGLEDYLFEKLNRLSLETIVNKELLKTSVKTNLKHATYYQPITCRHLKIIFRRAMKTQIPFEHFIDIGAAREKPVSTQHRPAHSKDHGIDSPCPWSRSRTATNHRRASHITS